jgi:hypothetical protein
VGSRGRGIGLYRSRLKNCRFRGAASGGGGGAAADANARRMVAAVLRQRTSISHTRRSPIEGSCGAAVDWPCATTGYIFTAHRSFQRFRLQLRKAHGASIRAAALQAQGGWQHVPSELRARGGKWQHAGGGVRVRGYGRGEDGRGEAGGERRRRGQQRAGARRCGRTGRHALEYAPQRASRVRSHPVQSRKATQEQFRAMLGDDPLVRREEVARPSLARPVWVKRTPTPEKAPRAVPSLLPMSPLAGERQAAAFDAAASAGAASASFAPSSDTPSLGGKVRFPPDPCDARRTHGRARRGAQPIGERCM